MNPGAPPLDLRDIHLPDGISWWPPAPGWWLILITLIVLAVLGIFLYRYRQRHLVHKAAKQALDEICRAYATAGDDQVLIKSLSIWLRRVCLSAYPRVDVAGLTGTAWLGFLDQQLANTEQSLRFSEGSGRVLIEAPYQAAANIEAQALIALCRAWLRQLPRRRSARA